MYENAVTAVNVGWQVLKATADFVSTTMAPPDAKDLLAFAAENITNSTSVIPMAVGISMGGLGLCIILGVCVACSAAQGDELDEEIPLNKQDVDARYDGLGEATETFEDVDPTQEKLHGKKLTVVTVT